MIVAIDGTAGSGKSSIAEMVSLKFDFVNINSGNLYRAVAYSAIEKGIDPADTKSLEKFVSDMKLQYVDSNTVKVDKNSIESPLLHTSGVDAVVSKVSNSQVVRNKVNATLNAFAKGKNVVCEGRDIASVVFPDAEVKIFMDADLKTRAMRRSVQYNESHDKIISDLINRDKEDKNREFGALVLVPGAHKIDTTALSQEDVYKKVAMLIRQALAEVEEKEKK